MSLESVMPSNHLILSHPLLLLPSTFPSISLFWWVGSSHQEAKILELQHQSFQWIFSVDFLQDWLVWSPCCPRDSLESQYHSLKVSILWHSTFFMVQLAHAYMTAEKNIALPHTDSYRPLSVKWYLCFLVCCLGLSLNTLTIVILIFVQAYPITKFPVSLFPLLIFFLNVHQCLLIFSERWTWLWKSGNVIGASEGHCSTKALLFNSEIRQEQVSLIQFESKMIQAWPCEGCYFPSSPIPEHRVFRFST